MQRPNYTVTCRSAQKGTSLMPGQSQLENESRATHPMKVMVVIPTYNEADNLSPVVGELRSLDIPGLQILVVDDNSPDGTGDLADDLSRRYPGEFHVIHRPAKLGLGTAYLTGFRFALGR